MRVWPKHCRPLATRGSIAALRYVEPRPDTAAHACKTRSSDDAGRTYRPELERMSLPGLVIWPLGDRAQRVQMYHFGVCRIRLCALSPVNRPEGSKCSSSRRLPLHLPSLHTRPSLLSFSKHRWNLQAECKQNRSTTFWSKRQRFFSNSTQSVSQSIPQAPIVKMSDITVSDFWSILQIFICSAGLKRSGIAVARGMCILDERTAPKMSDAITVASCAVSLMMPTASADVVSMPRQRSIIVEFPALCSFNLQLTSFWPCHAHWSPVTSH